MAYTRKMAGKVPVLKQDLVFDATPTPGSENAVTSGGIAEMMTETVAPAFSASSTYAIGEVVIGPDGKLYQCTTAVETAGEWDTEDWTETSMVDLIEQDMKDMEEMFLVNLPIAAKTLRFEFSKMDYDPTVAGAGSTGTWKKLSAKFHNVWDWSRSGTSFNTSFGNAFKDSDNLVKVIAVGDLSGITDYEYLFRSCSSLVSVVDMSTSSATTLARMFFECTGLKKLPRLSTGSVTTVLNCFYGCFNVESGALALYEQMSTQVTPPETTSGCFTNCGRDTPTGAAELAQIPASWGGTAAG